MTAEHEGWPALPVDDWAPTRDTVHLVAQMVGKVKLGLTPLVNHWWNITLQVDARGLTTGLMPCGPHGLELVLDLCAHELVMERTDGAVRRMPLRPRTIAATYAELLGHLDALAVPVTLNPMPTEILGAIRFDEDETHEAYDADAVHRFWVSLVSVSAVLERFRAQFRGKASPVHFFWGAFDLAASRFSGRPAPPHPGGVPGCPDWVMREAYSDEVSSCGYWPGGASEGAFYSYTYPEPEGFRTAPVPDGAWFDEGLGEFLLPYEQVRRSADPQETLLAFLEATYAAGARGEHWPAGLVRGR